MLEMVFGTSHIFANKTSLAPPPNKKDWRSRIWRTQGTLGHWFWGWTNLEIWMTSFVIVHPLSFQLCVARGFVCEGCHSGEPLFPFQLDEVVQCGDCRSCYHKKCVKNPCSKCVRLKNRWRKCQTRDPHVDLIVAAAWFVTSFLDDHKVKNRTLIWTKERNNDNSIWKLVTNDNNTKLLSWYF